MISAIRIGNAEVNKDSKNLTMEIQIFLEQVTPEFLKKYEVYQRSKKICGITKPLTSYVVRHSFANCLNQIGVSTDIISE